MIITELIQKSQNKAPLSKTEIDWLVTNFTQDKVPDYQVASWLATVFLNPLTEEETHHLTEALCNSGKKLKWDFKTVDKHSTGGVGDKTSLILAPLVAALGYNIPMMAGRGLGHTGGTIDKLNSIGFETEYSSEEFKNRVIKNKLCLIGQSQDFCPADKKFYALRDATHTVANIPLICSSIMSKKIAEGLSGLVLDIKYGSGAFMESQKNARLLAEKLISIGEKSNIKTFGVLSSMEQPLGRYIGNKLELIECLEILKDPTKAKKQYQDTYGLSLLLSALMVLTLEPKSNLNEAYKKCEEALYSGRAYEKFLSLITEQKGDLSRLKLNCEKKVFKATQSGFMNYTDVKALGLAAVQLGAGRLKKEDPINFDVGFFCYKKNQDPVEKDEPLFDIYFDSKKDLSEPLELLQRSFHIETSVKNCGSTKWMSEIIKLENKTFKTIEFDINLTKA
jgi:pyrimidine-nucleoside phosphorylase